MIRMYGKALVATWRPYEDGGGAHMRTSHRESENVTVLDQTVIMQDRDGFWETFPLANCSIIWQGKPVVTLITLDDKETALPIEGKDHTLADELAAHSLGLSRGPMRAMETSDKKIEGR
jgi:hypothetical protein